MTLEERETEFINKVYAIALDNYHADLLEDFTDYWCEPNKSQTKMRFEGQKFFDINRRLRTWQRNKNTNFGRAKNITVVDAKTVKPMTITEKLLYGTNNN